MVAVGWLGRWIDRQKEGNSGKLQFPLAPETKNNTGFLKNASPFLLAEQVNI